MWHEFKLVIEQYTGLDKDALHVHGAICLYIFTICLFRLRLTSFWPWLLVMVAAMANEAADLWGFYTAYGTKETVGTSVFQDSVKDIWNTMLWPSVALLAARYLYRKPRSLAATDEAAQGSPS